MQDMQDMMRRLNQSGKRLSKGHRKIAEYIVEHYDKAVFMTASKLGEKVGVSESTVVRFASAMGYEGYPQLQRALQELVRHWLTAVQRFEMATDIDQSEVLRTVLHADMQNIRTTTEEIDTAEQLFHIREKKGMTLEKATELCLKNTLFYGTMMLKMGDADAMVAGAINTTGDVLRPALQIIKGAPGIKTVSSCFLMEVQDHKYGDDGVLVFGDCAVNIE